MPQWQRWHIFLSTTSLHIACLVSGIYTPHQRTRLTGNNITISCSTEWKICGSYNCKSSTLCKGFLAALPCPLILGTDTCTVHWILQTGQETHLLCKTNWLQRMSDDRHLLPLSIVMCFIFHPKGKKKKLTLNWLVNYAGHFQHLWGIMER